MSEISDYVDKLKDQIADCRECIDAIRLAVERQANDEALWVPAVTATEAYLQQELRKLHLIVEGK